MDPKSWEMWLAAFLKRHPLKEPPQELRRDYKRQVMDRILPPAPVWVFRPRPAFGWIGALAGALAVLVIVQAPNRAARQALQIWNEMEEVEVVPADPEPAPDSDKDLERDLQQMDEMDLAS